LSFKSWISKVREFITGVDDAAFWRSCRQPAY
jgi:hypothetical protein